MKVLVDENLSPALARALNALFHPDHRVVHLREMFGSGVTDSEWIAALSRESGWIILSGDRNIRKNRAEYQIFRNSSLIGFFLSRDLYTSPVVKQAERILASWPLIEQQAAMMRPGAMFEISKKTIRLGQIG